MSEPRVVVPWTELGLVSGQAPPQRFVVVCARPSEHATFLGGIVTEPGTFDMPTEDEPFDERRLVVAGGGLFDEGIFGALPRRDDGSLVLDRPEERQHVYDRPQAKTFGTIVLPEPIRSPWEKRLGVSIGTIQQIPVLPAGLRPFFIEEGRSYRSQLTMLYEELVFRSARMERALELGLEAVIEIERKGTADAVAALFFAGAKTFALEDDIEWVSDPEALAMRADLEEEPLGEYVSLLESAAQGDPSRFFRWLDVELRTNRRAMSASRWPGDAHLWRACSWAAGLEIVPLGEDGSIEEELVIRAQRDRRVQTAYILQERVLGAKAIDVAHIEDAVGSHLDIHAFEHGDAVLLVTQGMAKRDCDRELLCLLPAGIDPETRRQIMRALAGAARAASRYEPLQTYEHPSALAEGSSLSGFIFVDPLEVESLAAVDTLEWLLPLHPQFLLAVGIATSFGLPPDLAASALANGGVTAI